MLLPLYPLGIGNDRRKIYGIQFHPEVDLTENGAKMIDNFLRKIVGLSAVYTLDNRELMCIQHIQKIVGDKSVLVNFHTLQRDYYFQIFKRRLL